MHRAVLFAALICACGRDETRLDSVAASAPVSASVPVASTTPDDATKAACAPTGLWATCAIVERLERSGLLPRVDSSARAEEKGITAPGTLLRVGNSELELFIYPTAAAREAEAARLDSTQYLAYTSPLPFKPLPTLIQSANLIAILHSRNDHQRERVGDAITAGPPQPARP